MANVSSSFEFTDITGSFTLGEALETITFSNGEAKSIGNFSLYRSGSFAWMIDAGKTGKNLLFWM